VTIGELVGSDFSAYPNVKRWLHNMKKMKSWEAWRSALAAQRPRIPCLRVTMVACARRTGSRKN